MKGHQVMVRSIAKSADTNMKQMHNSNDGGWPAYPITKPSDSDNLTPMMKFVPLLTRYYKFLYC